MRRLNCASVRPWARALGLVPLVLAVAVAGPAGPAGAATPKTVSIPQHPAEAGLRLVGASAEGVAVEQAALDDGTYEAPRRVYTGRYGTELELRRALLPTGSSGPRVPLAVAGRTLAWYESVWRVGSQPKDAHRLDLVTGEDKSDGFIAQPAAFNGESWFSHAPLGFSDYPSNWDYSLRQYHISTRKHPSRTDVLMPKEPGSGSVALAADASAVLRATSHSVAGGDISYAVDLVDLRTRAVSRVHEGEDRITAVALSADALVWVTAPEGADPVVNQRLRAGGDTVSRPEPDPHAVLGQIAVGAAGVGYLVVDPADPNASVLRVLHGGGSRDVSVPPGSAGLAAVGDRFVTAAGGYAPGVYAVDGESLTKVATVPSPSFPTQQWSLSASQLRYSDESEPSEPGRPVWERTVSGGDRATFSRERRLARTSGPMAFSAGRGAVAVPGENGVWELLDRGEVTERVEALGAVNVSGPYTLIGGKVFRPDGERIYTEPNVDGWTRGNDDIFGSTIVFARADADGAIEIVLDDAEKPDPTVLDTATAAGCAPPLVSVWGETVAWTVHCGDKVRVRNLRTGADRTVPTGTAANLISLSEGTLLWVEEYGYDHVIDLTSPTSVPVTLPDRAEMIVIDDHRVARDFHDLWDRAQNLQMTTLPFRVKYAPRLIARLSPLGFTPDGDGHADLWQPQFDVTKPLKSATLKITDAAGHTVATRGGTAPDGSIRDLSWDGMSDRGIQLPGGVYRWTLTGRADDGDGTLVAADGSPTVTGTVEIDNA